MAGANWFVHPIAYTAYLPYIIIAVLAGVAQKKANGGYLEFGEALKTVFTVFVVGSLIGTTFMYVLLNFVDEPFRQALAQETSIRTAEMMKNFGASQQQIDKAAADALNGNNYNAKSMAMAFVFFCIIWFIFSLIIAAIIKKKKPEF